MIRWISVLMIVTGFGMRVSGQTPPSFNAADLFLGIQKLKVLGSVLYIAAHPDDENTRLLAYLSKEKKYRTAYLSLTRGDGGQNLIGDEQGISLGLVRTQELLAARRIDGAEQFFSSAFDFGYSKTTEEALRIWNKEKILGDIVWVIRKFKPDVIITRFPPDNRAGHGHHSASAALAIEAFKAAADPAKFPEQIPFVQPWKATRILWNTFNFGGLNTQGENQYKMDVGAYNPLLGKGYGEIAAESRSQHKSQGFGVPRQRGSSLEYFAFTDGQPIQSDLLDNVETSWNRTGNPEINSAIDSLIAAFSLQAPEASLPALFSIRKKITEKVAEDYWRIKKLQEVNDLIKTATGLYFEGVASQQTAVTGDSLSVNFNFVMRGATAVSNVKVHFRDTIIQLANSANYNQQYSASYKFLVKENFLEDQPYWLREQMDPGSFNVLSKALLGFAQNPSDDVLLTFTIGGQSCQYSYPLLYKFTDPVKGEIYQPIITVPPIVVGVLPPVVLNNLQPKHPQQISLSYKSFAQSDTIKGSIRFEMKNNGTYHDKNIGYVFPRQKNVLQTILIPFDTVCGKESPALIYPWLQIPEGGKTVSYNNALKLIQYDHIPTAHYFFPNSIKIINEEIKVAGKKIGYIPGSGDGVAEALKQMGYTVDLLDETMLAEADLHQYDAIITGVRAYNIKESLNNNYERLMNYIKDGGNLIVQYNTSNMTGPVKAKIGPYPFTISRSRVADEKAPVRILHAGHPALNFPNKITAKDFEGWIQERSIYHASNWDSHYETILSINDAGEQEDAGNTILTKYGNGYFVYTGIVFFRELPAGVPGAYRLLANLIALNQKKPF